MPLGYKYYPLECFLKNSNRETVTLSFKEIEAILETTLPQSAHSHKQPWWANDITHSQAKAWLNAGYRTTQVVFNENPFAIFTLMD